jgi:glycosyltransferase involved in cell wall biosynthesis
MGQIVEPREEADLQVCSFTWDVPSRPARLFIDHGSFADAAFWAYTAPRLLTSDTILVSSTVCRDVADRFFGEHAPRITIAPFPIDIGLFRPEPDKAAARRSLEIEHGLPADGPLLLIAAAFVRRKNHHLGLMFLERLLGRVPAARLAIVGDVPDRPASTMYSAQVHDLARELGVASRVHFLGALPQDRLARLMAGSDLLVHFTTCRLENFGLVVAEAMASGLPVVAADWGGLRDLVVPGRTGFLADTYLSQRGPRVDWGSVIEPAARLLSDRTAWDGMALRAREFAVSMLGRPAYAARLQEAAREACPSPPREGRPVTFAAPAQELIFRTISLNARHPEIRDAGDEFRLLMQVDGGQHYRFLAGPAASFAEPPRVRASDRLYSVVRWIDRGGTVEILDPAWPARFDIDSVAMSALRDDGRGPAINPQAAQWVVDQGIACPLRPPG